MEAHLKTVLWERHTYNDWRPVVDVVFEAEEDGEKAVNAVKKLESAAMGGESSSPAANAAPLVLPQLLSLKEDLMTSVDQLQKQQ